MWQKILILSECHKKARNDSAAIVDRYLPRRGSRTWVGRLSTEGVESLKEALEEKRSRSMSVVAFRINKSGPDTMLWSVGSVQAFSEDGSFNTSKHAMKKLPDVRVARTPEYDFLRSAVVVAACFHDFGKMTKEFQKKLRTKNGHNDAVRHEVISMMIAEHIPDWGAIDTSDILKTLEVVEKNAKATVVKHTKNYKSAASLQAQGLFRAIVKYLVLSHHRLPTAVSFSSQADLDADLATYVSHKTGSITFEKKLIKEFFDSEGGQRILKTIQQETQSATLHETPHFSGIMTYARPLLILADHFFSSMKSEIEFPPEGVKSKGIYANTTSRKTDDGKYEVALSQPLDAHILGVTRHANHLMRSIYSLRDFPTLTTSTSAIRYPSTEGPFRWQACMRNVIIEAQPKRGFIGFVMARTGTGKTRANMIAMQALSEEPRVTIALGLRSLTLQTADAFKEFMAPNDLHMHIGSEAIRKIHESKVDLSDIRDNDIDDRSGSDTAIEYEFVGPTSTQKAPDIIEKYIPKSQQSFYASPVLVTTIDSLMALEKKPGALLRIASSDFILDELDNYDIIDQGAILRLIFTIASHGRKLIVSSATIPPELAEAVVSAYSSGYQDYCKLHDRPFHIDVGHFSDIPEMNEVVTIENVEDFSARHAAFTETLCSHLEVESSRHNYSYLDTDGLETKEKVFDAILDKAFDLHGINAMEDNQKKLSIGFIRIPDISTTAELSMHIAQARQRPGVQHSVICYHSQFPLCSRNKIESWLDDACNRKNPGRIWDVPEIKDALSKTDELMILVVATSVEEVGRDHDFDFMIHSVSDIQKVIQATGRVRRHRRGNYSLENCCLLKRPVTALKPGWRGGRNASEAAMKGPAFRNPGVETEVNQNLYPTVQLGSTNCEELLPPDISVKSIFKDDESSVMSSEEHRRARTILVEHPSLAARNMLSGDIAIYKNAFDIFPFRKNEMMTVSFTNINDTWVFSYISGGVSIFVKSIPGKFTEIRDCGAYFLNITARQEFLELAEKAFPDVEKDAAERLLFKIDASVFIKDGIPVIPEYCYSDNLGLFKPI